MCATVDEDSLHLDSLTNKQYSNICIQERRYHIVRRPVGNILQLCQTSKNFQKRPETSKQRIRFPLDAQVEMAFIIEIMPNFQRERLYSPFLKCFRQK